MPVGGLSVPNANAECAPASAGTPDVLQQTQGSVQNGCSGFNPTSGIATQINQTFSDDGVALTPPTTSQVPYTFVNALVRMVPGVQNVQLVGAGITQCDPENITNQYQVFLSLSGNGHPQSITLSPSPADASNNPSEFIGPASPLYLFSSRNVAIASCSVDKNTFSATCTITAAGLRGETEITIVNPRACNSMGGWSTASPTAGGSTASLRVVVA